ncbi:MAG: WD40 repeat domain-containing protein, partial [Candidatus Kapaibacterium sp.]
MIKKVGIVLLFVVAAVSLQARKADTLWTKVQDYYAPVLSPDDRLVGAKYSYGLSNKGFIWWDILTGAEVWRIPAVGSPPEVMRFTPDGKSVIVYRTHVYEKYDLGERTRMEFESDGDTTDYDAGQYRINDLSADGSVFMSTHRGNPGYKSDEVTFWDVKTGRIIRRVLIPGVQNVRTRPALLFSADNNRLFFYTSNPDGRLQWHLFDILTGNLTPLAFSTIGATEYDRTEIVLSPDKTRIAVFSKNQQDTLRNGVRILDGTSFTQLAFFPTLPPLYDVSGGCFSRDNTKYVSSCGQGWEIWDIERQECEQRVALALTGGEDVWITDNKRYLVGGLAGYVMAADRLKDTTVSTVNEAKLPVDIYPNPSTHRVHIRTSMAMLPGFAMDVIASAGGRSIEL